MVEQVFFQVNESGQLYIDFDALEQAGVAVDAVREHIQLIMSTSHFLLDGFYVNRSAREFIILYTDVTLSESQSCVVIPFSSRDYSVMMHDSYMRGSF